MANWRAVGAAIAGMGGVLIISAFGATSAGMKPYDSGAMASWVQAVGSIAAIIGAYLIGERQSAELRRQQLRTQRERLSAYVAIVNVAVERASDLETFICQPGLRRSVIDQFLTKSPVSAAADALRGVPLQEWLTPEAITAASSLVLHLERLHTKVALGTPVIALSPAEILYSSSQRGDNLEREEVMNAIRAQVRSVRETAEILKIAVARFAEA